MNDMMRRMQQMMQQSQAVRAAEREWAKLPGDEHACMVRKLEEQGDSISALTRRGILPSDARFAEMRSQCAATKAETPPARQPAAASPKVPAAAPKASAAAPSKKPATRSPREPEAAAKEAVAAAKEPVAAPKKVSATKPAREPSEDEEKQSPGELRETIKKLRSKLSLSDSSIAELEKAKDAAERSLKQEEQLRAEAQNGRREVERARAADKVDLQAAIAQLVSEKATAEAESARRERLAYGGVVGLLALLVGLVGTLVMSRHKASALQEQLARHPAPEPQSPTMSFAQPQDGRDAERKCPQIADILSETWKGGLGRVFSHGRVNSSITAAQY
jgi:hypothetical protein